MLMVSSRVMSAVMRGVMLLRIGHASLARSSRSDGRVEPMFGGTWVSSGPITSAMPSIHSLYFGSASASFLENLASCSWVRAGSSS